MWYFRRDVLWRAPDSRVAENVLLEVALRRERERKKQSQASSSAPGGISSTSDAHVSVSDTCGQQAFEDEEVAYWTSHVNPPRGYYPQSDDEVFYGPTSY
jgi:hypothetical protein